MSYQTQIATVITVVLVSAILIGYIFVLKRNGWISWGSREKDTVMKRRPKSRLQEPAPVTAENEATRQQTKKPEFLKIKPPIVNSEETKHPIPKINKKPEAIKKHPEGCNQYFGYLASVPKGTSTPNECYCCLRLIDCYKPKEEC